MEHVRLAIVGCGTISRLNAPGYLRDDRCDVVALCDPIRERAEECASEWRISPTIYTDYEDVLDDPNVDAVELLTPTHLHADQIIAGLEAGKHVSCQKPIAVSIPEADRVGDAVARANTLFRISENFLFYPPIVKAKELLDSGAIGDPNMVRIRTVIGSYELTVNDYVLADGAMDWRRDAARQPGGKLYDDGVHKYATAMWWVGDFESVYSIVTKTDDFTIEAPCSSMWRFKDRNCLGVIDYALGGRDACPQQVLPDGRVLRDRGPQGCDLGDALHGRDAGHGPGCPAPRRGDDGLRRADGLDRGLQRGGHEFHRLHHLRRAAGDGLSIRAKDSSGSPGGVPVVGDEHASRPGDYRVTAGA